MTLAQKLFYMLLEHFVLDGAPSSISLFAFGDASVEAYATAIYIIGRYQDGTATSELVLAKSRVAPIKMGADNLQQTIPRLELLAISCCNHCSCCNVCPFGT
jgi:hypothetical protein